jgi:hypothetical protein
MKDQTMVTKIKNSNLVMILVLGLFSAYPLSQVSAADAQSPQYIVAKLHAPLKKVGTGIYHKFGFRVYRATLWSLDGVWNPRKPYVLELNYARDVSKDTLVDAVIDDIRDQEVASDETIEDWKTLLDQKLPDVVEGDTISGLAVPGKKSLLFYNGKEIASISDPVFSKAFFDIWLGEHADEELRSKLLGNL